MSGNFRNKFSEFMVGRYGLDEFGKFLNIFTLIIIIASFFIRLLLIPALVLMGYQYFRMFSRNYAARNAENNWYLGIFHRRARNTSYSNDATHKIFKCPNCAQKIRVPKGKGKICIRCPKCRIEFNKRT